MQGHSCQTAKVGKRTGKTLSYGKSDYLTQRGLDEARSKEWETWKHFNAGYIVRGKELEELRSEGHDLVPTWWVGVDETSENISSHQLLNPGSSPEET